MVAYGGGKLDNLESQKGAAHLEGTTSSPFIFFFFFFLSLFLILRGYVNNKNELPCVSKILQTTNSHYFICKYFKISLKDGWRKSNIFLCTIEFNF